MTQGRLKDFQTALYWTRNQIHTKESFYVCQIMAYRGRQALSHGRDPDKQGLEFYLVFHQCRKGRIVSV